MTDAQLFAVVLYTAAAGCVWIHEWRRQADLWRAAAQPIEPRDFATSFLAFGVMAAVWPLYLLAICFRREP